MFYKYESTLDNDLVFWSGEDDPDYTEEFRELAEMELDGKERHMVLSALVKKG